MNDRAKTIMYIGIGIMALCLVVHFGPQETQADINPTGDVFAQHGMWVLTTDGRVFTVQGNDNGWNWTRVENYDPPIPTTEISMWNHEHLVARNGDVWSWYYPGGVATWQNCGPPPIPTGVSELDPEAQGMRTAGGCAPSLF